MIERMAEERDAIGAGRADGNLRLARACWESPLEDAAQLTFWRESSSLEMARALYQFVDGGFEREEPRDVWGWRLLSFLRRHCDVMCALRDRGQAQWSAERAAISLGFERVVEWSLRAPEPHASGLRKYLREVNGSRLEINDPAGRAQAFNAHGALTMGLGDKLARLSSFEAAAVAAGQSRLPRDMQELRCWVERAELFEAISANSCARESARAL